MTRSRTLREEQVAAIRALYWDSSFTISKISSALGVGKSTIHEVATMQTYLDVGEAQYYTHRMRKIERPAKRRDQ